VNWEEAERLNRLGTTPADAFNTFEGTPVNQLFSDSSVTGIRKSTKECAFTTAGWVIPKSPACVFKTQKLTKNGLTIDLDGLGYDVDVELRRENKEV